MTLIELMVSLLIGLGVTLAVTSLLIAGENHKRTTTSTNDAEQTGSYVFHALDGVIRQAGSAIVESAVPTDHGVLGCKLNVAASVFPRNAPFPAPFENFLAGAPNNMRVAPILIGRNQSDSGTDDVLFVMGGSGSAGGVSRQVVGDGSNTQLVLDNTVGFYQKDVLLLSQSGTTDCLLEEVASIAAPILQLSGTPYYTGGTATTLAALGASTSSYVTPLGNAAANNILFELFGVGPNRTLYSYDLLQNANLIQAPPTGDVATAIADGVVQLKAIYGIDNTGTNTGIQNAWAAPGGPLDPTYDIGTVMTNAAKMRSILSVRISIVVRGEYYDKNPVSPASLPIFQGLANGTNGTGVSLQQSFSLSANDQHYRYRVFEFTVPLRNMLLLAGA